MHDNAPCHKTDKVHDLLQEHNIPVMTWPANSPNLNLIEKCWYEQDGSLIRSLLESMPQHCADVIAAKGGHTKY